jgi:hypothetical protein
VCGEKDRIFTAWVQGLETRLDVASTHFLAASAAFADVLMAVDMHLTPFICRLVWDEVDPAFVPSQVYASHALSFRLHYDTHRTLSALTYCIPLAVPTLIYLQDLYKDVTPELVFGQREHETVLVEQYDRRQEGPRDVLLLLAEEFCRAVMWCLESCLLETDYPCKNTINTSPSMVRSFTRLVNNAALPSARALLLTTCFSKEESMRHHPSQNPDAAENQAEPDLWGPVGDPDPVREYQRHARVLLGSVPEADARRLDWLIAKAMAARGYSRDAIMQAIVTSSPHLAMYAAGCVQESLTQLLDEVMHLPEVVVSRQRVFGQDDEFGIGF